ncbi:hypothetical protein NDU88_006115 [Pleurodeles waltl]|uniref:Uncharacterized protein n=1 Tax=Pleurodeles waltl TaxID=8319 RepID=A0AAV7NTF9_PLEWA|nr:hypothetical protein NDU88_006115 [Pleurodeles waltl]
MSVSGPQSATCKRVRSFPATPLALSAPGETSGSGFTRNRGPRLSQRPSLSPDGDGRPPSSLERPDST